MIEGYALEVCLTTANSAAQSWYGYDQVRSDTTGSHGHELTPSQGIIAGILVSETFHHTFPIIDKAVWEGFFVSIFSVGEICLCTET
jgi:hypothetical protein